MVATTASEELVAILVDHLGDGVWEVHPSDGRIVHVNESVCRQLGATAEQMHGIHVHQLLVPPMPLAGWQLLVEQVPTTGAHRVTVTMRHHEGDLVPLELTLLRRDDTVVVITRDLTPIVLANERVVTEHQLLDRTLDALGDGVAIIDLFGRVERVNTSFARLVDLHHDRITDHSVFDPPWTWLDEHGEIVHTEATPPVLTLRNGTTNLAAHLQLRGTGVQRSADDIVTVRVSCEPLIDIHGAPSGAVLVMNETTEVSSFRDRLERLASTDPLTGLHSRNHITERVDLAVRRAAEADGAGAANSDARVGVLHVDLDGFRSVNDTFGAAFGDTVLAAVADRLRDLADRHVEIGRVGVDEFLVVATGRAASLEFDTRLRRLAQEIQRRTEQPLNIDGLELRLTASVGISRYPANATDAPGLVRAADTALTASRREGRHQVRFYERSLDERTRTGLALDRDLRLAAAQRTLEVHYQPIIDLRTGAVAAAEALVRWHHPEHGPIPPSVFIPTAEATGAISAISDMVVTTVAEDLAGWNLESLLPSGARIAINISATEFEQRGFVERLSSTLANAGVSPDQLELEITETLLMRDMETTAQRLTALDALGFLVALDDFGTGYSSLSYLHTLPLHTLKVDRAFVGELGDGRSETITRAILSLAQGLGIGTVGEGVETDAQRKFLVEAGCDLVQGFFYAPPLPRPAFEKFLRDHTPRPSGLFLATV